MIRKFPINSTTIWGSLGWRDLVIFWYNTSKQLYPISKGNITGGDSQTLRKMNSRRGTPKRYLLTNRKKWSSHHSPSQNETAPTTTLLHILAHTNDQVLLGTRWGDIEGMSWHLQTTGNQTAGKATMLSMCSSSWYSPVDNFKALTVARSLVEQFFFHGWSIGLCSLYLNNPAGMHPRTVPNTFGSRRWNVKHIPQQPMQDSCLFNTIASL